MAGTSARLASRSPSAACRSAGRCARWRAASTCWWPRPAACSISCNQRALRLDQVEVFVLDEADRMLDMGFIHDISRSSPCCRKERQTLFFSATMPEEITKLADADAARPGARGGDAAGHHGREDRAARHPHRQGAKRRCWPTAQERAGRPRAGVHPHQARRRQGRARPAERRASPPTRSTATSRRTQRERALADFRNGRCAPWSPPTSPPAASTSTASPT